jgi:protoporphyrinogen oxidase
VRVAVIGAGVCGLVAAHRIAAAGHEVDVYERWRGLGGQAATLDVGGGHRLERYYHHLFTTDRHIARLYEELGMPDELEWRPSSVAMFAHGRQWPFTTPADLLRFGPMPPFDRIRMGLAVLALQRLANDRARFERTTAREWIEKRMGPAAWCEVWGPMLRGKFGARADEIAMVWIWNKLRLRRGEDAREERLGYPRRSWEPLFAALQRSIESAGGRVLIDRPAVRIEPGVDVTFGAPGSFRAGHDPRAFAPAGVERYDRALATVPNDVFARLTGLPAPPIEYFAALCLLLELDRPFSDFYWTNVADRELPFVGVIEHTNLVAPERYDGRRFLYVANYLEHGHELLTLGPGTLLERYTPGLRAINPAFDPRWVKNTWLHREPAAQPIVTVGYHERIPPLRTPVAGLFLANTTQVYPEDRGTNYAVRLGDRAAEEILR